LLRLSLAAFLGALVGIERERKDWAAGLRTHMMVCVGAALTMMVSAFGFGDILGAKAVVLDPSRVAAQVISGLTTAAIESLLRQEQLDFYNLSIDKNAGGSTILLRFRNPIKTDHIVSLIGRLQALEGIRQITWDKGN